MSSSDDLLKRLGDRARARARETEACEEARGADRVDGVVAAIARAQSPRSPAAKPRRLGWRGSAVLAPFAAAAAVALGVRAGRPVEAPVGEYTFAVSGRIEDVRSASDDAVTTLETREGSLQQVIVRPREATRGPVAARALVVRPAGASAAGIEPEVSDLGVVRFDVAGERLRGASEVRVVIAPPEALASAVATVVASAPGDPGPLGGGAVVVRVPVEGASEKKKDPRR